MNISKIKICINLIFYFVLFMYVMPFLASPTLKLHRNKILKNAFVSSHIKSLLCLPKGRKKPENLRKSGYRKSKNKIKIWNWVQVHAAHSTPMLLRRDQISSPYMYISAEERYEKNIKFKRIKQRDANKHNK